MAIDSIDWGKLKPFAGDRRRSFEELCYQLVERATRGQGRLLRVDGSGGDGGVEMYLQLPNGDVWGWQAKFFWQDIRLDNGRKEQVKKSLASACKNHGKLVRWTLMTPGNLTPEETKWFFDVCATSIHAGASVVPAGRTVELDHAGESKLLGELAKPGAAGMREFFFGELELDINWFSQKAAAATAKLRGKYLAEVHASTGAEERISESLVRSELEANLTTIHARLLAEVARAKTERTELDRLTFTTDEARKKLDDARAAIDEAIAKATPAMDTASAVPVALREHDWRTARSLFTATPGQFALDAQTRTRDLGYDDYELRDPTASENAKDAAWRMVRRVRSTWGEIHEQFDMYARVHERLTAHEWHLFAAAGFGKTHVAAHIVSDGLKDGYPGLLLVGEQFTTEDPIATQIQSLLDVGHLPWATFVGALEACADAHHVRIPLVIDGLNEATRSGALSPIWRSHLASFCADLIAKTDAIVVVTTCRDSYEDAIWDSVEPTGKMLLGSHLSYDVDDAVKRYFDYYKIVADIGAAPRQQFQHPIYLRLFCEATNPERSSPKHVMLGEESLFAVFDRYLDECNRRVAHRLGRPRGARLLDAAVTSIAWQLWTANVRGCLIEEAYPLVEGRSREDSKQADSIVGAMEQEDLLVFRDWSGAAEVLRFTYDLMSGYLIATALLASDDLATETTRDKLFSKRAHPLAHDIVRCLAALAPRKIGKPLRDVFPKHERAFAASINALFEIAPDMISDDDVALVERLFAKPPNQARLLDLASRVLVHPGHKLNVMFWGRLLENMSLPSRDLVWSEHVRRSSDQYRARIAKYEEVQRSWPIDADATAVERARLGAVHMMWMLTSTFRPLRDESTRGLYWYGRRHPAAFIDMLVPALEVNDPYVGERMLAAAYGVAMARSHDEGAHGFRSRLLPKLARLIYDQMFVSSAPHSTTHTLARDYARHTIEVALRAHPTLLSTEEQVRVRPPFNDGGVRAWGEAEERDDDYKNGSGPIQMDFGNYTLGRLIPERRNYDYESPEYKLVHRQIFWRIYQLGYDHALFADVDRDIASHEGLGRREAPGKTDRYGKKYSWIAYFELYGYRDDLGLLEDEYIGDDPRTSDVDIDPSFPETPIDAAFQGPDFWPDSVDPKALKLPAPPTLANYIFCQAVEGDDGPWVILDGFLSDKRGEGDAAVFGLTWIKCMVVDADVADELVAACNACALDVRGRNDPTEHYTFAGEIPWADTFGANELDELGYDYDRKTGRPRATCSVLPAIRDSGWEDYHTTTTEGRRWASPTRQISELLRLHSRPERWDLFDEAGISVTRNRHFGDPWKTGGHMLYIRRSFLEVYLAKMGKALLIACTGARRIPPKGDDQCFGAGWSVKP